jgi:Ca2+-binding RTX toxin-like protein
MMADLFGNNLANNLTEGVAADNILGAGGNDTLNGGDNHSIYGDWANDSLNSGAGEDFMYGGEGNDTLNTLEADIDNGIGDDVYLGEGNDTLNTLEADIDNGIGDDVYLGEGNDTLNTLEAGIDDGIGDDGPIVPNALIWGDYRPNDLTGTPQGDTIYALEGNDTIDGLASNDLIYGDAGNDSIDGGSGNDWLEGGSGNDTINGGRGNDILIGGPGINQFLFNTPLATAGVDSITDFYTRLDKIILDESVFSAIDTRPGRVLLATDFAVINVAPGAEVVAAGNSGDEIVYNRRTGNLFYNPNNDASGFGRGGGRFATIVGSPDNLSNTDFRVVR